MHQKFYEELMSNLEMCSNGNLRERVASFIDTTPSISNFKGDKYYALEDALVDFVANLIEYLK